MAGRPQRSASVQPVTPGRIRGQAPAANAGTRKTSAQLQELDEKKLEGDPLYLFGASGDPAAPGAEPTQPGLEKSVGYRLVLRESDADLVRSGIGIADAGGTVWFQAQDIGGTAAGGNEFRFYTRGAGASPQERLRIDGSTGGLKVGSGAPAARLDVGGDGLFAGPIGTDVVSASSGPVSIAASVTICDATGGAFTATLPPATGRAGYRYTIKRINAGANAVTVDGDGGDLLDGMSSQRLDTQYSCVVVVSDGSDWILESTMGTVTGIP